MIIKCTSLKGQKRLRGAIKRIFRNPDKTLVFYNNGSYSGYMAFREGINGELEKDMLNEMDIKVIEIGKKKIIQLKYKENLCVAFDSFEERSC